MSAVKIEAEEPVAQRRIPSATKSTTGTRFAHGASEGRVAGPDIQEALLLDHVECLAQAVERLDRGGAVPVEPEGVGVRAGGPVPVGGDAVGAGAGGVELLLALDSGQQVRIQPSYIVDVTGENGATSTASPTSPCSPPA